MRKLSYLPLLLLALVATSCGITDSRPSATGTWTANSQGWMLNLNLSEANNAITGSGSLAYGSNSIPLTVTGTNTHPTISMTMSSSGYEPVNFQGTFTDARTITGSLNGSGFQGEQFILIKQ